MIAVFSGNSPDENLQMAQEPPAKNIEKARTLIKQVLALADRKGMLPEYYRADGSSRNTLVALWNNLAAKEDIRTRLNHVLTLVSYAEALMLMEAVMGK